MVSPSCSANENLPETLLEQCLTYIVIHLDSLATVDPDTGKYCLKEGLTLPSEICERLIEIYQQRSNSIDDHFINIFNDREAARLRRVRLRNSTIHDDSLRLLLKHTLLELDVVNCKKLTEKSFNFICEYGASLVSLSLGPSVQIDFLTRELANQQTSEVLSMPNCLLKTPNLKRLTLKKWHIRSEGLSKDYFATLITPLTKLIYLDLSDCHDLGDLSYLTKLPNLTSLILYNVQKLQDQGVLASIKKLTGLRHLDISQLNEKHGVFTNPNQVLASIVESLPNLVSLDISGTNLAGTGVAEPLIKQSSKCLLTDIPGLRSRVNTPFEFLGLYGTHYEACRRHDIPAQRISGDATEEQILNAALACLDRSDVLQKVLNDLYHLFRFENCANINTALNLVLESMDRYIQEKHIQISGSATLFYIAKMKAKKPSFTSKMKRRLICTLLNGMNAFQNDETMMRNGCLTLYQFSMPDDVLFDYERLIRILLTVVSEMEQESFVQRIGIFLLNSLACQVDGAQKQLLGDLGAISKMLELITDRLKRKVCDDVLEVAWSTMWNVTDETAVNCQRFLEGNGMELFLGCLSVFPEKEELLRNMMGLLGNVAEVKSLRPLLMTDRFVTVFTNLLNSYSDGIEVSYNAAGVLAHMCSDGIEAWTVVEPSRDNVLRKMIVAIERWDLSAERNINYRSFQPILGLLKIHHTPECQHWAAWALANLTKVYPAKYCSLVENEGGILLLEEVINSEFSYQRIKQLARIVINNCEQYKQNGPVRSFSVFALNDQ